MANTVRTHLTKLLESKKLRENYLAVFVCVALVVATSVALLVKRYGLAASHQETVLDCHYDGNAAHTHNADCYDADGNLVCPLPERELHIHDDSCYTEQATLVCGFEEGEEHVHTSECYQTERILSCGKEEVTEEHVHGPGCFTTITVNDGEEPVAAVLYPEQSFNHEFKNEHGGVELRVDVHAPEGALPEGTTMRATMVDPNSLNKQERKAVDNAIAEKTDGVALEMQAVDITFLDAQGNEIEPKQNVTVIFTSPLVDTQDQTLVVHVEDEKEMQARGADAPKGNVVDTLSDRELSQRSMNLSDNQLAIDSSKFSMYLLATVSREQTMTVEGEGVSVTVDAPADAGIAANAELRITEVKKNSDEWASCEQEALEALGTNEVSDAQFFNLEIVSDGQQVQQSNDVQVTVTLTKGDDGKETKVVQLGSDPQVVDASANADTVSFTASDVASYGIVETTIEKSVLASDGKNYKVSVTYGADAGIPENADLSVEEIVKGTSSYDEYVASTESALGMEEGSAAYIRLFDIKIVDKSDHDVQYQPKDGSTVDVKIELADMDEDAGASVVHFGKGEEPTQLNNTVNGNTVSFEANSFSVFAVAIFDDIVESTPYMTIRVHSSVPRIKVLKSADSPLFEDRDVIEAYEVRPHSSQVNVTLTIDSLPSDGGASVFELLAAKDGVLSSLGEVTAGSTITFKADEVDAFALAKSQSAVQTITGEYGIQLTGNLPIGAYAVVKEAEPVEVEGINPEIAFAYDIKIFDANNKEWQPAAGESVECVIPYEGTLDELESYYWVALHTSEGATEQLQDAYPVEGGIRFTTTSFSTFTLQGRINNITYGRTTIVHFVDHLGNEIQGMPTGTVIYGFQVPYDLHQYQDDLDPAIADEYDFSRVYVQLNQMQKDIRYLYLGTVREIDGSGSGYRVYMFMNDLDEAKPGGTYNGTWYTGIDGGTNDVYIVFNHVEEVSFKKVDSAGEPLAGATFTLYTDKNCVNAFAYNDTPVTATSDDAGNVDFGRIPYGTYYMKETTTPSGLKETGTVYTVEVNGNTSVADVVNEDDDGSVTVKETKTMNITKAWSDEASHHTNDSVTIKLFDNGTEAASATLNAGNNWRQSINNLDPTVSYMVSETSVTSSGEDVTNGWIPTISSVTTSTTTGYYQTDTFQQGEQYVIVYNNGTALRSNGSSLSTSNVTVQNNMLSSTVNSNMLWQVDSVSNDGVIELKNVYNRRYLNYPYSSYYQRWFLGDDQPQFIRYRKVGLNIQIFYRQNMNDAKPVYLNGTGTSTNSGTNFTLYKKVNVRTENVTITNKPAEYPVMMKKLEYSSGAAISGTTFDLYTEDEYNNGNLGTPVYTGLTSGSDGYLTTDGTSHVQLLAGTYYLVETQATDGYVNLTKPVTFTISRGGRFTARSADQEFTTYNYASSVTDDGTTYPLLKVPNQKKVTLIFKAEEGVDHVEFSSGSYIAMTGNNTKELTVVVPEVTGEPVVVKGIAEDGQVVNGWTINDSSLRLTTSNEITTAIGHDSAATQYWTDRTYHVWAESEKAVTVSKEVKVLGSLHLDEINTTAYFVVWDSQNNRNVLDENGNKLIKSIPIVNGIPQRDVVFDGLTSGRYSVWEVDANGNDLSAGTVVIGGDIAVSKIETRQGETSGNSVTLSETNREDGVTVINTYNHKSDVVDWTINKQWFMEKNTVNQSDKASTATSDPAIPTGATSTLALYRQDDLTTPLQTIVLDGVVDENGETAAWKATFTEIPIKDGDGNDIRYVVKEIAFTPEKSNEDLYIYPYTAETDHDGGTIRNAVTYGNIRIYKQFEIQPHINISDFVGNLTIRVTGPHGYDETLTFPQEDNYNPSIVLSDVPSGVYHIAEMNYEDLIPNRKWNPTASYIFASRMPAEQSGQQGQNRHGETETDVLVGTNGSSDDTVEVRIKNDYQKLDISATKVWDDDLTEHPAVELILYRVDDSGNKQPVGRKTIPANATGDDLTVVWEQVDQQYNYVVEEVPVYGYEATVTGDALNGFTVTNTPKQETQLTVVKKVEGAEAAKQKTYKVRLILEGHPESEQIIELNPAEGTDSKTVQVHFGTYTVEELTSDPTDPTYTIDIDDYDRTTSIAVGEASGEEGESKTVILQDEEATITITNKYKRITTDVLFKKVDGNDHDIALSADYQIEYAPDGVHYATINNGQIAGVTDSVFNIAQTGTTLALPDGYYRLTERVAPEDYHLMSKTIVFTVDDGEITLVDAALCADYATEIQQEVPEGQETILKTIGIELYDYAKVPISIWKTDSDEHVITTGASFILYKADNFDDESQHPIEVNQIICSGTTGEDGILTLGELELGEYRLVETQAPAGYYPSEHAIKMFVTIDGISAIQETGESNIYYKGDANWVVGQDDRTAQIRVWNNPGAVLPHTGGAGTTLVTAAGVLLIAAAGLLLMRNQKHSKV